jgi:hypothetical protein
MKVPSEHFEDRPQIIDVFLDDPARLLWGSRLIFLRARFFGRFHVARIAAVPRGPLS